MHLSMRYLIAAAGVASVLLCASAGLAQTLPVEREFEQICLAMTDVDDAMARARTAGYVTAPPEMRKRAAVPQGAVVLMRTEEARMTMVILARQKQARGGPFKTSLVAEMCSLSIMAQEPDLRVRLEALLGVGPKQQLGKARAHIFVYAQRPAGREPIEAKTSILNELAQQGALRMVDLRTTNRDAMLMLIAPHP